jgi:hypothetical protein
MRPHDRLGDEDRERGEGIALLVGVQRGAEDFLERARATCD